MPVTMYNKSILTLDTEKYMYLVGAWSRWFLNQIPCTGILRLHHTFRKEKSYLKYHDLGTLTVPIQPEPGMHVHLCLYYLPTAKVHVHTHC